MSNTPNTETNTPNTETPEAAAAALTPDAEAAAAALATALAAVNTADAAFRKVQGDSLPAVADAYVKFHHAGVAAVVACGVPVPAASDASAIGKAVREARDTIPADAAGKAGALRELLASLTGTKGANQSRWSRSCSVALNIGKADKSGARLPDVQKFVRLHLDTDTAIGIGTLATWCNTDMTAALAPKVKTPETPETNPEAAAAGAAAAAAVVAAGGTPEAAAAAAGVAAAAVVAGKAETPETPETPASAEAVSLRQAVEMLHRGMADAAVESLIAASPIDLALVSDDRAAALLAALLAAVEMQRRADAAVGVDASDPLAALLTPA